MSTRPDEVSPEEREARIAELRARRRTRMRTLAVRSARGMGVLLFGAGWGFIAAGRRAGQADIDALSALIEGALRAPKAEHGPP